MNIPARRLLILLLLLAASPAYATILYVPADYETIQDAIHATSLGDTVLIADGVYTENIRINEYPIVIGSEFLLDEEERHIINTRIVGLLDQNRALMTVDDLDDPGMEIIGLTFSEHPNQANPISSVLDIFESYGTVRDCRFSSISPVVDTPSDLYSLYLHYPEDFEILNCSFEDLTIGGVKIEHGSATLRGCTFERNVGSCFYSTGTQLNVLDCLVGDCIGTPYVFNISGFYSTEDTIFVSNSTFANNYSDGYWSGALTLNNPDVATIDKCTFTDNITEHSGAAGLVISGGIQTELTDCLFEGNVGYDDGAALYFTSSGLIRHCSFKNNSGPRHPAMTIYGLRTDEAIVDLDNNLFMNNTVYESEHNWGYSLISTWTNQNAEVNIHESDIVNNQAWGNDGVLYLGFAPNIAQNCFWGDPSGPYHSLSNATGLGDTLTMHESYWEPWSSEHHFLPNLRLTESSHDFGQVEAGDEIEWTMTIYNSAYQTVQLEEIVCDNEAFWFDYDPVELESGEETTITVHFIPQINGNYSGTAHFVSNDLWNENDLLHLRGMAGTNAVDPGEAIPTEFILSAAWPNPFNATTEFTVALPHSVHLTVEVVDLLGRQVATLFDQNQRAGIQRFNWDATRAGSGLYFLVAQTSMGDRAVEKVVLIQ